MSDDLAGLRPADALGIKLPPAAIVETDKDGQRWLLLSFPDLVDVGYQVTGHLAKLERLGMLPPDDEGPKR